MQRCLVYSDLLPGERFLQVQLDYSCHYALVAGKARREIMLKPQQSSLLLLLRLNPTPQHKSEIWTQCVCSFCSCRFCYS